MLFYFFAFQCFSCGAGRRVNEVSIAIDCSGCGTPVYHDIENRNQNLSDGCQGSDGGSLDGFLSRRTDSCFLAGRVSFSSCQYSLGSNSETLGKKSIFGIAISSQGSGGFTGIIPHTLLHPGSHDDSGYSKQLISFCNFSNA